MQLISYLDVRHSHAGSTFFVKVVNDWTGSGCFFRDGQIIEGRVALATARDKQARLSQLAVAFEKVPCTSNKTLVDLVVAAAFFDENANLPNAQFPLLRSSNPSGSFANSIQRTFTGLEFSNLMGKDAKRPHLESGDVIGMKGVKLRVGVGPGKSTILESTRADVRLDKEATLLLVPASMALTQSSAAEMEMSPPSRSEPAAVVEAGEMRANEVVSPAPQQEFLPCEPQLCSVDLPPIGPERLNAAMQSIPIRSLGYAPRPQRKIGELSKDDAVAWLGSNRLIIGFNPHKLIPRSDSSLPGETVRRIHAVILDIHSRKVVTTADWELHDRQEYLWQLPENRALIHMGDELKVLGEDMAVVSRLPLDGPLAFVRISPNGELMAVGTTHERHSPEIHLKLKEALDQDPDEDVHIQIFDKFKLITKANSSRAIMPPILLNEGQVRLLAARGAKYRMEMLPWNGNASTIARFSSACIPGVTSFPPDLLFVTSCSVDSGAHEFRVVRANGTVVLRGKSDPQNLGQEALGNSTKFAVKLLHATHRVVEGSGFRGADLDYVDVRIYRTKDGGKLTTIQVPAPPPSRGAFALSADGSRLAIVTDAQISIFPVQ